MALTRKFLSALGIEADKIDEIIEEHAETVNALKSERDDYKESATKAEELEKELAKAKETIEAHEKDSYQVKYEAIKEEFDAYKKEQTEKETLSIKDGAYRKALKDAGVSEKRIDSIMKVTDLKNIEIDENGEIKEADKLAETIKTEWSDFITQKQMEGAGTENPPAGDNGGGEVHAVPSIF